jgi:hypothetical protein
LSNTSSHGAAPACALSSQRLNASAGASPSPTGAPAAPAGVERVELQRAVRLGAQPPDAGIAVAVVVAVLQRELRLADAAHAVDRDR